MADDKKDPKKEEEKKDGEKAEEKKEEPKPLSPEAQLSADLSNAIKLIESAVVHKDFRLFSRVLRTINSARKRMSSEVLANFAEAVPESKICRSLLTKLDRGMATDSEGQPLEKPEIPAGALKCCLPEVEMMLAIIATTFFIDSNDLEKAKSTIAMAINRLNSLNRRSMDKLSSSAWFYYSRVAELTGNLSSIREEAMNAYRTACLHHNHAAQATIINILLRDYLDCNLVDQAFKLVSKTTYPEQRSNAQYARYLYYLGRIKAIQLEYSDAHSKLIFAVRKAPQSGAAGRGFRLAATKLAVIVELLTGEIPERDIFNTPDLREGLAPYFQLTCAVRLGDLNQFHQVFDTHKQLFQKDKTYTLIKRLSYTVIKAGLLRIAQSYSRISFADISQKLGLGSKEEAEFVVAKAVLDGVIEATIDHEAQCMTSKARTDLYCSSEPQRALHKRITFCLSLYNDLMKSFQYPDKHKGKFQSAEELRNAEDAMMEAWSSEEEF